MVEMQALTPRMKNSGAVEIYQRLREISGGKVLDVATQQGGFIDTMMDTLKDYDSFFGIDITSADLEKARSKFVDKPVEFEIMNAENMAFEDSSFDTVCISYSIHHLENPKQVLTEIKRVLKPGGHLIIQECVHDGDQSEAKRTDIAVHHWSAKLDSLRGLPHFNTFSRKKLRDLVQSIKFENVEIFESKRNVNCLFCEEMEKCEDPKYEDIVNNEIKEIDNLLEKLKEHPNYDEFCLEADLLRKRVRATGVESADFLFFICRK
jgi:ubiquinone/menaquinone biosynthesis C-methylase UbiE